MSVLCVSVPVWCVCTFTRVCVQVTLMPGEIVTLLLCTFDRNTHGDLDSDSDHGEAGCGKQDAALDGGGGEGSADLGGRSLGSILESRLMLRLRALPF